MKLTIHPQIVSRSKIRDLTLCPSLRLHLGVVMQWYDVVPCLLRYLPYKRRLRMTEFIQETFAFKKCKINSGHEKFANLSDLIDSFWNYLTTFLTQVLYNIEHVGNINLSVHKSV